MASDTCVASTPAEKLMQLGCLGTGSKTTLNSGSEEQLIGEGVPSSAVLQERNQDSAQLNLHGALI